jgi:hypothetical protein
MVTKEKLSHGEGKLVEGYPKIGSRKRTSQSEKMAPEEGISQNKTELQKTLFAMSEMVKALYEDYLDGRCLSKGNLQNKTKVKKERILLKLLLHLLLLHYLLLLLLLLLQVQVQLLPHKNIAININMICHYLSLM